MLSDASPPGNSNCRQPRRRGRPTQSSRSPYVPKAQSAAAHSMFRIAGILCFRSEAGGESHINISSTCLLTVASQQTPALFPQRTPGLRPALPRLEGDTARAGRCSVPPRAGELFQAEAGKTSISLISAYRLKERHQQPASSWLRCLCKQALRNHSRLKVIPSPSKSVAVKVQSHKRHRNDS